VKQNQNKGVSSSKNSSHWNGADNNKFDFVGSTMTDNEPDVTDLHIPAGPRDSYGPQDVAFSMR